MAAINSRLSAFFQPFLSLFLYIDTMYFLNIIIAMRILLCGMGNRNRGDDGFGSYVVENIHESDTFKKINCSLYPENYLNKIVSFNPDLIIFLDTIKQNGLEVVLLRNEEITESSPISVSTHNLPFSSIYQYLKENSNAHIWFLGMKPHSYEQLSDETMARANRIIDVLNSLDKQKNLDIIKLYENLSTTLR